MDHLGTALIAIPWLHVIREHPIFLNDYEGIYNDRRGPNFYVFFKNIVVKFLLNFRFIIESSLRVYKKRTLDNTKSLNSDFLFISHLINDSQLGENNDFYFSNLPQDLYSRGLTSQIALINHTQYNSCEINKNW
jgi:hypothetical protein